MNSEIQECKIGDRGTAKSALAPSGIVEVDGRDFSARAVGQAIDPGTAVFVTAGDIGGLVVRPVDSSICPEKLPKYGEPAYDSFGDKAKAVAAKEEEERRRERELWRRKAIWRQLQIGSAFSIVATFLLDPLLQEFELPPAFHIFYGVGVLVAAFGWAIIVFRAIDHTILQFEREFTRLVSVSTLLALGGTALGLWSMQSLSVSLGMGLAVVSTIAGAFIIPALSSLFLGDI